MKLLYPDDDPLIFTIGHSVFQKLDNEKYLDKEGTITEDSIGGINTNLLPIGAKVIKIDPKSKTTTINFENEILTFEL